MLLKWLFVYYHFKVNDKLQCSWLWLWLHLLGFCSRLHWAHKSRITATLLESHLSRSLLKDEKLLLWGFLIRWEWSAGLSLPLLYNGIICTFCKDQFIIIWTCLLAALYGFEQSLGPHGFGPNKYGMLSARSSFWLLPQQFSTFFSSILSISQWPRSNMSATCIEMFNWNSPLLRFILQRWIAIEINLERHDIA